MRNICTAVWLVLCAWVIFACASVSNETVIEYVKAYGFTNVRVEYSTWKVIEAGCSPKHSSAFQVRATHPHTGQEKKLLVCIDGLGPVELRSAYRD